MHVRQRRHAEHQHFQPARQARHRGRQRERQQLVARRGITQGPRPLLVVAHRTDHFAERGVQHAQHEGIAQGKYRQREVVHRHHVLQIENAEQLAARHALQAVLAPREARLHRNEVDQLRQRQGDHREVDALAADGDGAEHQPQQPTGDHPGQEPEFRRGAQQLHDDAGCIRGRAKECRMAERQQTHIAHQQIECRGEQREAQHLHQERGVDEPGRGQRHHGQHRHRHAHRAPAQLHGLARGFGRQHVLHLQGLAEQPGRLAQQHQHHDDEDRQVGGLGVEHLGQAFDDAQPEAADDGAHDGPHAANHHHREHHHDQVGPHHRAHLVDGRRDHARHRRQCHA
ncbi:hypothetical protein D3C73_814940 [compost metagenome]